MRTLFLMLLCCCVQLSFAQIIGTGSRNANFLQTLTGEPVTSRSATRYTDGTPYLANEWMRATIITPEGQAYKDEMVKLNLLEGKLHYRAPSGHELVAVTPIKEVIVIDETGKAMKFIHSSFIPGNELGAVWLQELSQGPVRMFKHLKKDVKEMKAYGSSTTEVYVTDEKRYYLLSDNNLQKIKKLKDITDLLSAKENELAKFIRDQSLKDKAETDMARLVDYYNSLSR
ncbi:MAG: hypothetical protein WCF67_04770 [Chitinophagaceae bacterium]